MSSQLLINEPPLQVLPTLAKEVGLNEAIILQQVHYWLNPQFNKNTFEGRYWVHNTLTQWQRQFAFWSSTTIKRTIANLEESGLLMSFRTRDFKKTKYYTLNYDLLSRICLQNPNQSVPVKDTEAECCPEDVQNLPLYSWVQSDPLEEVNMTISKGSEWPDRCGQNGPIDRTKMTPSHYRENTTEITSENTPPPLTPPPKLFPRTKEEEEVEEIYFEQEHSNWNSEQGQIPPMVDSNINEEEVMQEQQTQDLDLCSELITHWNQIVQNKLSAGSEAYLTNKRKALWKEFLKEVLPNTTRAEQIDAWQNYCTLIAKSQFLTGNNPNGFKVTLDWTLVPDNAFKILEGAYYDKPSLSKSKQDSPSWEEFSEDLVRTLPSSKYLTEWVKMSVIIAKFIGQEKYKSWFATVALSEVTETKATFLVEGQFIKDSILRYFSSEIRCAVQNLYPKVNQIEFKVVPPLGEAA